VGQVPTTLPVAGRDYPATFQELTSWFHDEAACAEYLEALRWPNGFVCPRCSATEFWRTAEGLFLCRACRKRTSITSGTIFHRSHLSLTTWFAAIWLVTATKNGISALSLQDELGLGSYDTAWALLHRLRRVMVRPGRERLSGLVEVDEIYVGARESGVDGRLVHGKAIVICAVELREPKGLGRVRLRIVPEASRNQIFDFIQSSIERGARVRTDGWNVYDTLPEHGYLHEPISVKSTGRPAHVVLPGVHRVASLLKRWIAGTLQDGVSHAHLAYYLDEFTFRFNRRNSTRRGLLFYRLLDQAVHADPVRFGEIVGGSADPHIL
jgi:transposase-like protein